MAIHALDCPLYVKVRYDATRHDSRPWAGCVIRKTDNVPESILHAAYENEALRLAEHEKKRIISHGLYITPNL